MLTIDDVRAIPLFSTLAVTELERLAQTSADLHLCAGEFAVHEGGERALFAVLSGKIEVVKLIDGIERTLGWRAPGHNFRRSADRLRYTVSGRLSSVRTLARHACGSSAVLRHRGGIAGDLCQDRRARTRAYRRAPGHRRRTAQATRHDGRASLGHRLRRVAPVPRAEPDYLRLDNARFSRVANTLARNPAIGRRLPRAAAGRRDRRSIDRARATLPGFSAFRRLHAWLNTTP